MPCRSPWLCVRWHVVFVRVCTPCLLDHIWALLGHHYDRRYGIAVGPGGEHGRIHHPQIGHTEYPELWVDNRLRVADRSHLASPRMVVLGFRVRDHHAGPVCVRAVHVLRASIIRRSVRLHVPLAQCPRVHQRQHDPYAFHHGQHVPRVLEVIGLDDRVIQRVAGPQRDVALAPCQQVRRSGPHVRPRTLVIAVRRTIRIQGDLVTVGCKAIEVYLCIGHLNRITNISKHIFVDHFTHEKKDYIFDSQIWFI